MKRDQDVWQIIIDELGPKLPVTALCAQRQAFGLHKYGKPVTPCRFGDVYDELMRKTLDQAVYFRAAGLVYESNQALAQATRLWLRSQGRELPDNVSVVLAPSPEREQAPDPEPKPDEVGWGELTFETMFTYHPPNPRTVPLYRAVNAAEAEALAALAAIQGAAGRSDRSLVCDPPTGPMSADLFAVVNAAALTMGRSLDGGGPALYFSAAIQNTILFRNACNEALVHINAAEVEKADLGPCPPGYPSTMLRLVPRLLAMATTFAQQYRWLANGAIAIGDAVHFTPEPTITDRSNP